MRLILFGVSGQLGQEIKARVSRNDGVRAMDFYAPDEKELDLRDSDKVMSFIDSVEPDCILNVAAYTAVDQAEVDPTLAYAINRDCVSVLVQGAKIHSARFVHVSTDYVFDGQGSVLLKESDPTNPLGVYGMSKYEGELVILKDYPEMSLIARTASLHGRYGNNFVHTILELFKTKERIQVVSDQVSSPTWAGWLAETLLELCARKETGVFHTAGKGAISWYEFACAIKELVSGQLDTSVDTKIEAVSVADYKRPAPRPKYSALDCSKLTKVLGREPIICIDGLRSHLKDLGFRV